jgi:AraC family transcriptional regulator
MISFSQPTSAVDPHLMDSCGVRWGLLGRVASPRGVAIVATDGLPNDRTENDLTVATAVLGYSLRMPADIAIGRGGRPFQPIGPLNFYSPGVSLRLRCGGPITLSFCVLSAGFLASLSETDGGVRIDNLDFLPSIESERLTYLGRAIFREALEPGFASSLLAEAMGMEVALEIARYDGARRADNEPSHGGLAPWQMRRLEAYIRDNLSGDLSLSELAALLNISVRHLSRAVRQAKGVSVHRWIVDRRLAEARRLLSETDLPIHEIALRCAFHSAAAFSAAFRGASGYAPGEFRRLTLGRS